MELPSDLLPEETFKHYLIDELGVSEDVAILDMAACLGTTVVALAEQVSRYIIRRSPISKF